MQVIGLYFSVKHHKTMFFNKTVTGVFSSVIVIKSGIKSYHSGIQISIMNCTIPSRFLQKTRKYYRYKNNLKIMNLKKGVGIDHCHKKQGNKVNIMHLPALSNG